MRKTVHSEEGFQTSYAEEICKKFLKFFLEPHVAEYNFRPSWLFYKRNNCELDIYYPMLNFALEFNGPHHKKQDQAARDKFKQVICHERGIYLITVSDVKQLLDAKFAQKLKHATGIQIDLERLPEPLLNEIKRYRKLHRKAKPRNTDEQNELNNAKKDYIIGKFGSLLVAKRPPNTKLHKRGQAPKSFLRDV